MAISLTAEDLAPLVPLAETRAALREALLPHCDNHCLAANARLEVDHSTTNVYLLTGGVRAQNSSGSQKYFAISGDTRLPLPLPFKGRGSITTESSTHIITVDRRRVNTVLAWANLHDDGDRSDCWLPPILRSELLARLPAPNVHALLLNASAQSFKPNTRIVSQGDGGEYNYLTVSGTCQVTRETDAGLELVLATLEAGESFGEEALLTGETRNAAIEAGLQGATVLAIGAADFCSQIEASLVSFMDFPDLRHAGDRAVWLDVRTADEFAHDGIPGATHIPLDEIRDARDTLTRGTRYLVYCDSGRRAAAAAFLMAEAGLDAIAMTGSRQDLRAAERGDEEPLKRRLDGARERLEASFKGTAHPGADEKAVRTVPDLRAQYADGMGNKHPPADVARPIMAEDSLWLQMQSEVESLLRKEADVVKERAAEAASQLELAWDQRTAAMEREARELEADQTLLADIGAQLHAEDVSGIAGEAACPRARSEHVEETLNSRLEQSRARRESIARARAHLARLRKKNPPETRD